MKEIALNQENLEKIKEIAYFYDGKIPEGINFYYDEILKGNDLDMYMQTYSLSKEDLIRYARVCKILATYKEITELIEIINLNLEKLEKGEIEEYQEFINDLQSGSEEFINDIDIVEDEEENIEYAKNTNLIIYSNYIEESNQKTVNAHSGKEEQTKKGVANLIEQMKNADYQSLRKKGYIHQNQQMGSNKPYYVSGNAFERMGRGSTKVNYIRIPVSENNKLEIKKHLNGDFDTFYLVVCYGDFKNEGIDEIKYYNEIYLDLKKHLDETLNIINIFKNDFTEETFDKAMSIIDNGFIITDELTSILKNRQSSL